MSPNEIFANALIECNIRGVVLLPILLSMMITFTAICYIVNLIEMKIIDLDDVVKFSFGCSAISIVLAAGIFLEPMFRGVYRMVKIDNVIQSH